MSAWQEFDQWVEDTFDPDTEFTPTVGEFLLSPIKLPGHLLMGPSTEDLFYFNLHMLHFGAHYAWHASRVGAYAAWDTFAGYRMSQQLSRPFKVARFLASPVGAFAVGALSLTYLLGKAQREGWLGLGGNFYEGPLPDDWQGVPLYKAEGPTYTR